MWVVAGFLSLCLGFVYAELGTLMPRSGGDFTYIKKVFGNWPAFLAVWTLPLFVQTASTAVLGLVFADYLLPLVMPACAAPQIIRRLIAAIHILTIGISNAFSPRIGVYVQIISMVTKVLALVIIVVTGAVNLGQSTNENFSAPFQDSSSDPTSYGLAMFACLFAYAGYQRIGEIADEVKDSNKNIPIGILLSIVLVTILYVLVNVSYFILLPKTEFLASAAVAYSWAQKAFPSVAVLIPIVVLISVYGANNGGCFAASRIMFAAARAGHYPEMISFLHIETQAPVVSIILYQALSLVMLIPGDIMSLINFMGFVQSFIVLTSSLALLRLKYIRRGQKVEGFTSPIVFPIIAILGTLLLILAPFLTTPRIEFLYGAAFAAGGYILYIPFVHFGIKLPGIDKATTFFQLLCNGCPTEKVD